MQTSDKIQLQWQETAFQSFLDMAKASDGDFAVLGQMMQALSDRDSLDRVVEFLSRHPQGKQAFEKRIRLGEINLQKLHQLPKDTLGYQYADHLIRNQLIPQQAQLANNDYEYLIAHITETHDIWHIVTGSNTDILGEIKLEAFYVSQLYASRFWLALLAKNLLKAVVYDIEAGGKYMEAITEGWTMAKQAKPLFGIVWNQLWEVPLEDVRNHLNLN